MNRRNNVNRRDPQHDKTTMIGRAARDLRKKVTKVFKNKLHHFKSLYENKLSAIGQKIELNQIVE